MRTILRGRGEGAGGGGWTGGGGGRSKEVILTTQVGSGKCWWLGPGDRWEGITGVLVLPCDCGQIISPLLSLSFPIYQTGVMVKHPPLRAPVWCQCDGAETALGTECVLNKYRLSLSPLPSRLPDQGTSVSCPRGQGGLRGGWGRGV